MKANGIEMKEEIRRLRSELSSSHSNIMSRDSSLLSLRSELSNEKLECNRLRSMIELGSSNNTRPRNYRSKRGKRSRVTASAEKVGKEESTQVIDEDSNLPEETPITFKCDFPLTHSRNIISHNGNQNIVATVNGSIYTTSSGRVVDNSGSIPASVSYRSPHRRHEFSKIAQDIRDARK